MKILPENLFICHTYIKFKRKEVINKYIEIVARRLKGNHGAYELLSILRFKGTDTSRINYIIKAKATNVTMLVVSTDKRLRLRQRTWIA